MQVGVYSPDIIPLMANSLNLLGMKRALVVHSMGLDELTPMGAATIAEIQDGKVRAAGAKTSASSLPSLVASSPCAVPLLAAAVKSGIQALSPLRVGS